MSLHAFNTACLVVALAGILLVLTARYFRTGESEHFLHDGKTKELESIYIHTELQHYSLKPNRVSSKGSSCVAFDSHNSVEILQCCISIYL